MWQVDYGKQSFTMLSRDNHELLLTPLAGLPQLRVLVTRGFNPSGQDLHALAAALPQLRELRLAREFCMQGATAASFQRLVTQLKVGFDL